MGVAERPVGTVGDKLSAPQFPPTDPVPPILKVADVTHPAVITSCVGVPPPNTTGVIATLLLLKWRLETQLALMSRDLEIVVSLLNK